MFASPSLVLGLSSRCSALPQSFIIFFYFAPQAKGNGFKGVGLEKLYCLGSFFLNFSAHFFNVLHNMIF